MKAAAHLTDGTKEVRRLQYAIAAVFLILGGWCLMWPSSVIALTVRPDYQTDHLLGLVSLGAFGAQAVLAGLFAAFSQFTRRTFAAVGMAILPFSLSPGGSVPSCRCSTNSFCSMRSAT